MNSNEIRLQARAFVKEFDLHDLDYYSLKSVIEKQGFTVVEFNHLYNNQDVELLIQTLSLTTAINRSRGFTYVDKHHRIVFINENLSDEEKLVVLAHEEGHIYCGHIKNSSVFGQDVQEEFEANEFVHFLLNQTKVQRLRRWVRHHKISVIVTSIVLIVIVIAISLLTHHIIEEKYYGDYYITETGFKYHKKNCGYVKDKSTVRRMTKDDYESGNYEPCGVCLP